MTAPQAGALLKRIRSAFPLALVEEDTIRLYVEKLKMMEHDLATAAVDDLVDAARGFPTIAELREAYWRHYRRAVEAREHERRELEERCPPPPEALEMIARIGRPVDEPDPPKLVEAEPGECEDRCGETGPRFKVGHRSFCKRCAGNRLRAAAKVAASAGGE